MRLFFAHLMILLTLLLLTRNFAFCREQNPPSMCHFDEALNADALSDDVVTTSPAGHYCVDVTDAERMTLWNETTSPETFL